MLFVITPLQCLFVLFIYSFTVLLQTVSFVKCIYVYLRCPEYENPVVSSAGPLPLLPNTGTGTVALKTTVSAGGEKLIGGDSLLGKIVRMRL